MQFLPELRSFAESQTTVDARAWAQGLLEDRLPSGVSCSREDAVWVILKVPREELPVAAGNARSPSVASVSKPPTEFPSLSGGVPPTSSTTVAAAAAPPAPMVGRTPWGTKHANRTEISSSVSTTRPAEASASSVWAGSCRSSADLKAVPAADDLMAHVWAARPQNIPNLSSRVCRSAAEGKGTDEGHLARIWGSLVAGTALAGFSLSRVGPKSNDRLVGGWIDPGPATDPPPVVAALQLGMQCLNAAREPHVWTTIDASSRSVLQCSDDARQLGTQLLRDLQSVVQVLPPVFVSAAMHDSELERSVDASKSFVDVDEDEDALRSADASGEPGTVSSGQPFDPLQDSRHHFRSRAQVSLYQNRQRALDEFQQMLREFRDSQEAVNPHVSLEFESHLPAQVRSFLDRLLPANAGWFAQCFVRELMRSGMVVRQEHDARLVQLAGRRRVQQLHARLTTAEPPSARANAPPAPRTRIVAGRRAQGSGAFPAGGKAGKGRKPTARVTPVPVRISPTAGAEAKQPAATVTAANTTGGRNGSDRPDCDSPSRESDLMRLFPGSQRFFALFLRHADSHRLASQLQTWLVASLIQSSPSDGVETAPSPPADAAPRLEEPAFSVRAALCPTQVENHLGGLPPLRSLFGRIQRSRICARFLGLLLFSPGWDLSHEALQGAAVDSALRDTVRCATLVQPPLDISMLIDTAVRKGALVTVIPWACDCLRMLRDDRIAASSARYRHVLDKLRAVYWRLLRRSLDRATALPLTRGLLVVQWHIESLFRFLGLSLLPRTGRLDVDIPDEVHRGLDEDVDTVGRRCLSDACPFLETLQGENNRLQSSAHGATSSDQEEKHPTEEPPAFRVQPFQSPRKVRPVQTSTEVAAAGDGGMIAQQLVFGEAMTTADSVPSNLSSRDGNERQEDATFALAETLLLAPFFQQRLRRSFLGKYPAIQRLVDASVDTVLENCLPKAAQEAATAASDEAVDWFRQSVSAAIEGARDSSMPEDLWKEAATRAERRAVEQAERLALDRATPVVGATVRSGLQLHEGTEEGSPAPQDHHTSVAHVAALVAQQSLEDQVRETLPRTAVATVQAILENRRRQEMKALREMGKN